MDSNKSELNKTKEALKKEVVVDESDKKYTDLESLIIDKINTIAEYAKIRAKRDEEKPKYKFLGEQKKNPDYAKVGELKKRLDDFQYKVKVIEKIEVTNAEENKYLIRIENKDSTFYEIDLIQYQKKLENPEFNDETFWAQVVTRMEGYVSNKIEIADIIIEYLSYIIYFKEFYTLTYSKLGWHLHENKYIFKYNEIISDSRIKGEIINEEEGFNMVDDTLEHRKQFLKHTVGLMNKHNYDALLFSIGISGLVRSLLVYSKETNLNINLLGSPAIGKSTLCHYILSFFGDPKELEGAFTSTDNSVEEIRVTRSVLPYVLDERMLKFQNISDNKKEKELLLSIFRDYEGRNKDRYGGKSNGGERAYGALISTSTESMMDLLINEDGKDYGQYRRFIEFKVEASDLFKDNKEAKETEHLSYSIYGIGCKIIVEYLLSILNDEAKGKDSIQKEFDEITDKIDSDLEKEESEKYSLKLRNSSSRFALIIYSYKILCRAINYYKQNLENDSKLSETEIIKKYNCADKAEFYTLYNEIREIRLEDKTAKELFEILKNNLIDKMNYANSYTSFELNSELYKYIEKHKDKFLDFNDDKDALNKYTKENKYIGMYKEENGHIEIFTLWAYAMEQFFCMNELPQPDDILAHMAEIDEIRKSGNISTKQLKELSYKNHTNSSVIRNNKIAKRTNKPLDNQSIILAKFLINKNTSKEKDETK